MSILHDRHKESQMRHDKQKDAGEKEAEKKESLKDKILHRIKGKPPAQPAEPKIVPPKVAPLKTAPETASPAAKDDTPIQKKISQLLNEVKEMRNLQQDITSKNEENRAQLADAKKLVDEYSKKIKHLEEENKRLDRQITEYASLKTKFGAKDGIDVKSSDRIHALVSEKRDMQEEISGLKQELEDERKKAEEIRSQLEGQPAAGGAEKHPEVESKRTQFLETELKKREEVIEILLSQRKIDPEHERLMIIWLNAALDQERKNNAELKRRLSEFVPELKEKDLKDRGPRK